MTGFFLIFFPIFTVKADIWDLQNLLIAEKWSEIKTDSWEIVENLTDN